MPIDRPTLAQIIDSGAAEFESRLPGVLVRVRRSLVGVVNRVLAAGLSSLYQYVEYKFRQVWPDRADDLVEHGARWGVNRIEASSATGTVLITGTNGVDVLAGTALLRADGARFTTDADVTIAAGVASVAVTADEAGQLGNTVAGVVLSLETPIDGVSSSVTCSTELSGGADIEGIESWRARILHRIRKPPQGGSVDDYTEWALEVPGVTRIWVAPGEAGPGTVTIRFVRDNDASLIPDAGEVAAVQAYIDARRPVTSTPYVVAPVATAVNFTIALTPNTATIKAAVEAELADAIFRDGVPGGTLYISRLREAVSIAAGEENHVMTVPSADVVFTTGQLPVMGVITWA